MLTKHHHHHHHRHRRTRRQIRIGLTTVTALVCLLQLAHVCVGQSTGYQATNQRDGQVNLPIMWPSSSGLFVDVLWRFKEDAHSAAVQFDDYVVVAAAVPSNQSIELRAFE